MAPSLGEQVLQDDLLLHKILLNLSNVHDLRTIQGLVSLYAVKILSKDTLKEHLARFEGVQYGVHYEEFEKVDNSVILEIGETDPFGTIGYHVGLYEYLEPEASRHVKPMVSYIKDMHRDHKIPYPKGRVSLNKLKKKQDVLKEYGFLTYIPLSVYKTVRKGLAAEKLLRSRSVNKLIGQGEAYPCFYSAFDCGLEVDLVKPLVPALCFGREHIAEQAMVSASLGGHVDLLKCILDMVDIHINDPVTDAGTTVLHFAAQGGHLDVVRYLVEKAHAAVNASTYIWKTPLIIAAEYGHIDIIKYLAQCDGAVVDGQDDDGMTALMMAIQGASRGYRTSSHWTSVVRCLIEEAHVDIKIKNVDHMTALMQAASWGLLDIVRYMIGTAKAVDINNVKDEDLDMLCLVASANRIAVMRYLVEEVGLDVNAASRSDFEHSPSLVPLGHRPLTLAVMHGHVPMTKYLIETGRVDVNAKNQDGYTALMAACQGSNMEIIKCLVEQGHADVSATDFHSDTCLTIAAKMNKLSIVKYLVEVGGADVLQANEDGKHALQIASDLGSIFMVEYLIHTAKYDDIHSSEEIDRIHRNAYDNEKRRVLDKMLTAALHLDGAIPYSSEDSYFSEDDDGYDDYLGGAGYSDDEIDVAEMMYMPEQFFFDDSDDDWRAQQAMMNNPDYRKFVQAMNMALLEDYMHMAGDEELGLGHYTDPPIASIPSSSSSSSHRGRGNASSSTNTNRGGRGGRGRGNASSSTNNRSGRGRGNNNNRGRRGRGGRRGGGGGGGSRGRGRGEHNQQ